MIFEDRSQAGKLLGKKLASYPLNRSKTVVVGITRGGVPVALEVAKRFKVPLVPLVIKKLSAPQEVELAIGATASFGKPVLDQWLIADLNIGADYLKKETLKKRKEAKSLEKTLGSGLSKVNFKGREIILVDDGVATGQTMKAAAKILRELGAAKIILAAPCGFSEVVERIRDSFDDIVILTLDGMFGAVGQFYKDFGQVNTEELKKMLADFSES